MRAHGIMFHHFHGNGHIETQGSINDVELDQLIHWLNSQFNLLNADHWLAKCISGTLKERDICLTFDDGLKCQYDVALPVLEAYSIKAFWFVYTAPVLGVPCSLELYRHFRHSCFEQIDDFYEAFDTHYQSSGFDEQIKTKLHDFDSRLYLAHAVFYTDGDRKFRFIRDQILGPKNYELLMDSMMSQYNFSVERERANLWINEQGLKKIQLQGHIIGLHSHTHPTRLHHLSAKQQHDEYSKNMSCLNSIIGTEILAMSHPCNSYNDDTLRILRDLGIQVGFCSNMEGTRDGDLEMPREYHTDLMKRLKQ